MSIRRLSQRGWVKAQGCDIPTSLANDHGITPGQVHDGCGLQCTGACVNHRAHLVFIAVANLVGVIERVGLADGNQRGGQQRAIVQRQQLLQRLVFRHPQTNGLA
jgi:hypothetical protein